MSALDQTESSGNADVRAVNNARILARFFTPLVLVLLHRADEAIAPDTRRTICYFRCAGHISIVGLFFGGHLE